jgi:hypothetical protein
MLTNLFLSGNKKITNAKFLLPKVEMKEQLEVTDLKGNKIGVMNVSISLIKTITKAFKTIATLNKTTKIGFNITESKHFFTPIKYLFTFASRAISFTVTFTI